MKELLRMAAYAVIGITMIGLLIRAASSGISAGMGVMLALLVVVVLPIVTILTLASRDKRSA